MRSGEFDSSYLPFRYFGTSAGVDPDAFGSARNDRCAHQSPGSVSRVSWRCVTIAAPGAVDASSAIPSAWPWRIGTGIANHELSPGVGNLGTGHPAVTTSLDGDCCYDSFHRVRPSGFFGSTPLLDQWPHYCYCCCKSKTDSRLPRKGAQASVSLPDLQLL